MKTYQLTLETKSGLLTPFQADTIFGHLCWIIAYEEGENGLQKFLKPFREGTPSFVVSDGFPGNFLPKPLSVEFTLSDPAERKEIKKIDFITPEEFTSAREGEKCMPIIRDDLFKTLLIPHNTIDRLSSGTLKQGGVYTLEETFIPKISIYIKVASEEWKDRIVHLVDSLSKTGYGRKKSIGKGQISIEEVKEYNGFDGLKGANGFVSLSNFCPKENDPTNGLYRTFVKYGKLGEEFTFCGNPFKKPLLMFRTGSIFRTDGQPNDFYGRMVEGIAPAKPQVVQYGFAFAVPIKIVGVI